MKNDFLPSNCMKHKDKKLKILKFLYSHKFDGKLYDIGGILEKLGPTNYQEIYYISKSLSDEGYIKIIPNDNSVQGKIISPGIEFIEELELDEKKYEAIDFFDSKEKEIIKIKLDEFSNKLLKLELGQQILHEDILDEIDTLKKLLNILGKKDWTQILKGKLIDAGFGGIVESVSNLIIETFKGEKLLN